LPLWVFRFGRADRGSQRGSGLLIADDRTFAARMPLGFIARPTDALQKEIS
jgi:hypothetical protein